MYSKARTVVITGANKGIGFELAKRLLKNPAKPNIVVTSRNETLGKQALNELITENSGSKDQLFYHVLDITKKETYAPFAEWITATFGKFDVLVNNAAIAMKNEFTPSYRATLEEAESILSTNYLKTREFTEFILPYLSDDGKVVNVSSILGLYVNQGKAFQKRFGASKLEDKDLKEIYEDYINIVKNQSFTEAEVTGSSYNVSKALMNAWTYHILKDSLQGEQQAYTVTPGWCRTDMGGSNATKSVEEGPITIEYVIDLPFKRDPETNGKFFSENKQVSFDSE